MIKQNRPLCRNSKCVGGFVEVFEFANMLCSGVSAYYGLRTIEQKKFVKWLSASIYDSGKLSYVPVKWRFVITSVVNNLVYSGFVINGGVVSQNKFTAFNCSKNSVSITIVTNKEDMAFCMPSAQQETASSAVNNQAHMKKLAERGDVKRITLNTWRELFKGTADFTGGGVVGKYICVHDWQPYYDLVPDDVVLSDADVDELWLKPDVRCGGFDGTFDKNDLILHMV